MIAPPLLNYLNGGRSGADFADYITDGFGTITYGQLQQLSKEQILAAMSMDQQLGAILARAPDAVARFVDEFLHPETVSEEQKGMRVRPRPHRTRSNANPHTHCSAACRKPCHSSEQTTLPPILDTEPVLLPDGRIVYMGLRAAGSVSV